ncbi:PilZ domain-containing protein [Marinagarivorans algicola]|uniref:PilZ domain-containing protein n=1 Tax=Marinagarivorans algicola TaxID=1513270 RepID=UPI0006B9EEA7|nr:PilZ domain-containing protein [Marinagarivorans algicola]
MTIKDPSSHVSSLAKPTVPSAKERREFFRIDNDVIFDVQPVDKQTIGTMPAIDVVSDGPSWQVLEALSALDQKTQHFASALNTKQPALGQYLGLINDKIDLIARHSIFSHYQHLPKTRISLSEEGLAFKNSRMLYKNSFVVVRIIFLPHFAPVVSFAQVIRCESRDNSYNVAAKFYQLAPAQQQVIANTLIKAQQRA